MFLCQKSKMSASFEDIFSGTKPIESPQLCAKCGLKFWGKEGEVYCPRHACSLNYRIKTKRFTDAYGLEPDYKNVACFNPRVAPLEDPNTPFIKKQVGSFCEDHLCRFVNHQGVRCDQNGFAHPDHGHCLFHWNWVTKATSPKKKCHCEDCFTPIKSATKA